MATSEQEAARARFAVRNVGGIDETEVNLTPGVTVLSGPNATNRTSFLQAIMGAMGSDRATLKGDADEGEVRLHYDGETYRRSLVRTDDGVQFRGEGYLDEATVADLFAFVLETNEPRQAVALDGDLREILMRPVDVDALQRDIRRLEERKAEINEELATIESRKTTLPDLERRRTTLREQIQDNRDELAALEEEIDNHGRDVEESRQERDELEAILDELRSTRSELESVRRRIESQQESIASLKRQRRETTAELDELPETPATDSQELDAEIERLRERRQQLNADISDLQSLVQYNTERLADDDYEVIRRSFDAEDRQVTDQLLDDGESVVCWTCGSTVDREQIEATVDRLRDLQNETVSELNAVKSELETLKTDQRTARKTRRRREELEGTLADVDDELDRRERQIDSLKDRRTALGEEIERLEAAVQELESESFEDVLELHQQANQLEFEIESLEADLEDVNEEISTIEARAEDAESLRADREQCVEELTDLRTRIDQLEREAVDAFNDHMDTLLDVLDYDNLDRIWIERVQREAREGRQTVQRTAFELHIVRTTENGVAYEDTVDHLSESEREVTGLVFTLAGYLVHDLHESVPFMLLDSLEAIDADRIAALVEHFADYAEYLVVALLTEDADALSEEYRYVTDL